MIDLPLLVLGPSAPQFASCSSDSQERFAEVSRLLISSDLHVLHVA